MTRIAKELIGIRLKPKTIENLKKISDEKEITTSELVRNIIENYLITR